MSKQLQPLIFIIVMLGALLFLGAVVWAGIASVTNQGDKPPKLPEVLTQIVTAIGATLATHFGAIFGISQFTGGNPRPIPRFHQIGVWARLPERPGDVRALGRGSEGEFGFEGLQVAAAYFYFGSLLLALVFWALTGFSDTAAEVLKNMTYTLIGVIAGVMAIVLNVKQ